MPDNSGAETGQPIPAAGAVLALRSPLQTLESVVRSIIIGGGIGGLTAAIALRKAGVDAQVYERAPEPREVGAGISIWANAIRALREVGAERALLERGEPGVRARVVTWRGRVLTEFDPCRLGAAAPALVLIHRAELLEALLECLAGDAVHFGHTCVGVEADGSGASARFADGGVVEGDLVVGADGINSVVRGVVLNDGGPRYSGYTCWRGIAEFPTDGFPAGHLAEVWGRGARFGLARIGRGRVYWWATENAPAGGVDGRVREELLRRFRGWGAPVCEVIGTTDPGAIIRNDIVDRAPARGWSAGRITLLGDAAHPTTPNLGQGGCMAIEDGVVLAGALVRSGALEPGRGSGARHEAIGRALAAYERARRARTARVTRDSWRWGAVGQWENAALRAARDLALRAMPRRLMEARMRALLEWEG